MSNFNNDSFLNRTPLGSKTMKRLQNITNSKLNTPLNIQRDKMFVEKDLFKMSQNIKEEVAEQVFPNSFNNDCNNFNDFANANNNLDRVRFSVDAGEMDDEIDSQDEREFYSNLEKDCETHCKLAKIDNETENEFKGIADFEYRDNYLNQDSEDNNRNAYNKEDTEYNGWVLKAKESFAENDFVYITAYELKSNESLYHDTKLVFDLTYF